MKKRVFTLKELEKIRNVDNFSLGKVHWDDEIPRGMFERFMCSFLNHCSGNENVKVNEICQNYTSVSFKTFTLDIYHLNSTEFEVGYFSKKQSSKEKVKSIIEETIEDIQELDFAVEIEADFEFGEEEEDSGTDSESNNPSEWDCFLSHSWGKKHATHKKVIKIGESLKRAGLNVWLDADQLDEVVFNQIISGIDNSKAFIAIVTVDYLLKSTIRDNNAGKEFNYAAGLGVDRIIPVVLDKKLLDTKLWASSSVLFNLGSALYIDFTTPDKQNQNMEALIERIKSR